MVIKPLFGIVRKIEGHTMLRKLWTNRIEFYPYVSILFFWFLSSFVSSLKVKSPNGITLLGLITIPSVVLILIAAVKTYRELSET